MAPVTCPEKASIALTAPLLRRGRPAPAHAPLGAAHRVAAACTTASATVSARFRSPRHRLPPAPDHDKYAIPAFLLFICAIVGSAPSLRAALRVLLASGGRQWGGPVRSGFGGSTGGPRGSHSGRGGSGGRGGGGGNSGGEALASMGGSCQRCPDP